MTVTEVLDYVKRLQTENVAQTANWSDVELYSILERKCNEVLSIIGLIEGTDSSLVSVASQADYTIPSTFINIRRVYYDSQPLKYLSFRQAEARRPSGTAPTGTPREWTMYGNTLTLISTPSDASKVIKIYGEKLQTPIISAAISIDIPAVFHGALCDAMTVDMFAKDLNTQFSTFYQNKWLNFHVPMMKEFAIRRRRRGVPTVVIDADSVMETEFGII